MDEKKNTNRLWDKIEIWVILLFCGLAVVLDFLEIQYTKDKFINDMLSKLLQQTCGIVAAILLMVRLKIKLFGKPQGWLFLIPAVIIALDNFPLVSYLNGNIHFINVTASNVVFIAVNCLAIGLFEELIFRGIAFSLLAGVFSKDKKGFLLTYVSSSLVFGLAHIFNGSIMQVGYTILTGGLFAFALVKTKNILTSAFLHALYNFCGLQLFIEQDLVRSGTLFDMGTVIMMAIISVLGGLFVIYSILAYKEEDRIDLYKKLGVPPIEKKKVDI